MTLKETREHLNFINQYNSYLTYMEKQLYTDYVHCFDGFVRANRCEDDLTISDILVDNRVYFVAAIIWRRELTAKELCEKLHFTLVSKNFKSHLIKFRMDKDTFDKLIVIAKLRDEI